jgi:hypothetical protein
MIAARVPIVMIVILSMAAGVATAEDSANDRAKALLEAIEKSCQARRISPGHGHKVLPVAQAILKIKDRIPEIKDADPVLSQVAALLHDIGGGGPPGEIKGPPIARAILSEQNCDPAMIERVCHIIATHHHLTGQLDVSVAERPAWFIVIIADRPEVIKRYEAAPADVDSLEKDVRAWIAKLNKDIHWPAVPSANP